MCLFVLLSCLAFLIYVIDAQLCVSVYLCLWVISTLGMYCSCSNVFFFCAFFCVIDFWVFVICAHFCVCAFLHAG